MTAILEALEVARRTSGAKTNAEAETPVSYGGPMNGSAPPAGPTASAKQQECSGAFGSGVSASLQGAETAALKFGMLVMNMENLLRSLNAENIGLDALAQSQQTIKQAVKQKWGYFTNALCSMAAAGVSLVTMGIGAWKSSDAKDRLAAFNEANKDRIENLRGITQDPQFSSAQELESIFSKDVNKVSAADQLKLRSFHDATNVNELPKNLQTSLEDFGKKQTPTLSANQVFNQYKTRIDNLAGRWRRIPQAHSVVAAGQGAAQKADFITGNRTPGPTQLTEDELSHLIEKAKKGTDPLSLDEIYQLRSDSVPLKQKDKMTELFHQLDNDEHFDQKKILSPSENFKQTWGKASQTFSEAAQAAGAMCKGQFEFEAGEAGAAATLFQAALSMAQTVDGGINQMLQVLKSLIDSVLSMMQSAAQVANGH